MSATLCTPVKLNFNCCSSQKLFIKRGGKIVDGCQVTKITPGDHLVTLTTTKGEYKTKKLVITAGNSTIIIIIMVHLTTCHYTLGPWSSKVLQPLGLDLPINVMKIDVLYWRVDEPDMFTPGRGDGNRSMGVFIFCKDTGHFDYYGLPAYEYPGLVKVR